MESHAEPNTSLSLDNDDTETDGRALIAGLFVMAVTGFLVGIGFLAGLTWASIGTIYGFGILTWFAMIVALAARGGMSDRVDVQRRSVDLPG